MIGFSPLIVHADANDHPNIELLKSHLRKSQGVIPVEAGIQVFQRFLVPGFCRGDGICVEFPGLTQLGTGRAILK